MTLFRLILLGGFELIDDHARIAPLTKKVRGLLAYLALTRPRPQSRERLASLLWPDSSDTQGRMSLRSALAMLRRALNDEERGLIVSDNEFVSIAYDRISVDVWELEAFLSKNSADSLARGFSLYSGELLSGLRFESFAFEQWSETERTRLHALATDAGARLLATLHSQHRLEDCISIGNRLLGLDPLREDVQRTLMRVHVEQGHPAKAIKQYQLCRTMLQQELGVSPELETEKLYQTLLQRRRAEGVTDDSPPRSMQTDSNAEVQSAPDTEPTHRPVAIMAIRMNSTQQSGVGDFESAHRFLTNFQTVMQTLLDRFGGVRIAQDDERILVAFGLARAHSNDAERAVRTALLLKESAELKDLAVGFAVTTGWVLASKRGEEVNVTGLPCADARTLSDAAEIGEIILSEDVYNALAPLLDAVRLERGALGLSGWAVAALRDALRDEKSPPFIGRREVLRQILGLIDITTSAKAAHAVLIRGEAGIGKTRLTTKLAELASKKKVSCFFVRLLDFGSQINRDPLSQLAHGLFGVTEQSTAAQRIDAAEHATRLGLLSPAQRVFAYMLLDLPQPAELENAFDSMELAARSRGEIAVLTTLLQQRSLHQGLLVIVEDIHWAPRDELDQVASLAITLRSLPVVLLLTSRPENDPIDSSWRTSIRGVHFSTIELPPFNSHEARQMAAHYADKTTDFVEACIRRAEGNPLFLDQLLRTSNQAEIPNSVQSVVLAHIDLLPRSVREALQAASVIGQIFASALVDHLLGKTGSDVDLSKCALTTRDGDELRFVHALVQEAVYASILRSRKVQLHLRAAEWFAGNDIERQAVHLDAAGSDDAASAYMAAADLYHDKDNPRAALRLTERGALLASEPAVRERLSLLRAQLLLELGDTRLALEAYSNAFDQASTDGNKRRALRGVAGTLRILDRHREALIKLDEAQAYAVAADDAEAAEEWLLRGNLHFPLGETAECIAAHQQARALAIRARSPRLEVSALGCLGDAYYLGGQFMSAHEQVQACVDHARRHGLSQVQAANQAMLAVTHMFRLEFSLAFAALDEAIDIARHFNLTRHESLAHLALADVLMASGKFERAKESAETGLLLARRVGARRFESDGLHQIALALYRLGEKRKPKQSLVEALALTRSVGEAYNGAWVLGVAALIGSSIAARRAYLNEGESLLAKPCVAHNHMYFFRYAIEVALDMQDWRLAFRYADSLEQSTRAEPTPWSDFHIQQGRVLARLGRGDVDSHLLQELGSLRSQAEQSGIAALVRDLHPELGRL